MVVNVEALDLALGSGGFDVVHVNLTRGLEAPGAGGAHVMKLNYSSLQHPVDPVEPECEGEGAAAPAEARPRRAIPVLVLFLHGQLAPAAWAAARAAPGAARRLRADAGRGAARLALARRRRAARARPALRARHRRPPATAARSRRSASLGALHAAADALGWDAVIAGPGPGILGSGLRPRARRHGGARHRARRAGAGPGDPGGPAALVRRPAPAPPRPQPPRRDRPAAAAGAGAGPGARARRGRVARRRGGRRRQLPRAASGRMRGAA